MSITFLMRHALLVSCRRAAVGGVVLVLFWGSWGIVWHVLALTRRVGNGSGGEVVCGGGGGGGRSDDVSDEV